MRALGQVKGGADAIRGREGDGRMGAEEEGRKEGVFRVFKELSDRDYYGGLYIGVRIRP
jgi:hypothetical protein